MHMHMHMHMHLHLHLHLHLHMLFHNMFSDVYGGGWTMKLDFFARLLLFAHFFCDFAHFL